MKNYFILRFLDMFKEIFYLLGADYSEIRLVLQLKLADGSRRSRLNFSQSKSKKQFRKFNFNFENFFLVVLGLLFSTISAQLSIFNPFLSFTFLFSIIAFFLLLTLFTEFSITFFDIKDAELLLPTPIKVESISIGKNLYLFFIFFKFALALSLPSLLFYGYIFNPIIVIPLVIMIIIEIFFLISIASILFGLLLKFYSGEKLKDFINYLQIGVSMLIFIGYQIGISNSESLMKHFSSGLPGALYLFPPAWFAGFPILFIDNSNVLIMVILTVVAFSVSLGGYLTFVKLIAPFFQKNLYKMKINEKKPQRKRQFIFFSKFFAKFDFGVFYQFANRILSSDRKLKMTIYPAVFISFFFPILLFYEEYKNSGGNIGETNIYYTIYILSLMTIQIYMIVFHSSYHKASWLLRYLPIKTPRPIYQGVNIAVFMKYQFSMFVIAYGIMIKIWGLEILPEAVIMILNSLIIIVIFLIMSDRILPFSREFIGSRSLSYRGSTYLLISLIIFPLFGGIHYLFMLFDSGVYILIPIQITALILLWRGYSNSLIWDDVIE